MRRTVLGLCAVLFAAGVLAACGDEAGDSAKASETPEARGAADAHPAVEATPVTIVARDFSFDAPATMQGGLVQIAYSNDGQEPHFAAFAEVVAGKAAAEVKAALTAPPSAAPPSGPPPFEDYAGMATTDPGGTGNMTVNFAPGTYVLYCALPSPDGLSHAAKGMLTEVTVTEGPEGALPEAVGTITAVDFALTAPPPLEAGANVLRLHNKGRQIHEINLVELAAGKTVEDVVAWYAQPGGPPPMRFLAGAAVKPGVDGTTEFDLKADTTYAFICGIPDFLGDLAPHVTKGMSTGTLTVS